MTLIERLRRRKKILHDADELKTALELINPDGPEAADRITELETMLERVSETLSQSRWAWARAQADEIQSLLEKGR